MNALGYLLAKHTKRFDEAEKYIQQALKLKPNDPTILDSLGWVNFKTGKVNQARSILSKAFKLVKNPEIASHLITVLSKLGENKKAKSIFDEMIKKHPDNRVLSTVGMKLK